MRHSDSSDLLPWDHPVPPLLYKYLPPERVDVLANCRIVFSHRKKFTDDHELSPDYASFGTEQQIWELVIIHGVKVADLIPRLGAIPFPRFVSLLANDQRLRNVAIESAKRGMKSPDLFGVFCLTEAENCERMWREYAADARGFALAFDTTCGSFTGLKQPGRFGKVTYSDEPVGTFLALTGEIGGAAIFFRKRMPYSFEHEWRSIRAFQRLEKGESGLFFSGFDPHCVREILVRPNCAVLPELQHLIGSDERYRHVKLIELP